MDGTKRIERETIVMDNNESRTDHAYRIAVALNNMGVSLMERGCYGSALKTLSDSLLAMKVAFSRRRAKSKLVNKSLQEKLDLSSQRWFRSTRAPKAMCDKMGIVVDPVDDEDLPTLLSTSMYGPNSSSFFPIRITSESWYLSPTSYHRQQQACENSDEHKYDAFSSALDISKHFGIMLYNHGVANFLLSRRYKGRRSSKLVERASKSLQMAETVLIGRMEQIVERHESESDDSTECLTDSPRPEYALLSAMVLNGLSLTYYEQGHTEQAKDALNDVRHLCSTVDNDFFLSTILFMPKNGAPAA